MLAIKESGSDSSGRAAAPTGISLLYVLWGVLGVVVLLGRAVWRLTPLALEPINDGTLNAAQTTLYVGWVLFSMYAEGYRGFQLRFSPRVVVRALHLAQNPRLLHVVLAPAFCMGLFHAKRRRLIAAWVMLCAIVAVVFAMHQLAQPWRGIIDGGVVIGLLWGILSILYYLVRALNGSPPSVASDLPD